jgi:hypothetical protein
MAVLTGRVIGSTAALAGLAPLIAVCLEHDDVLWICQKCEPERKKRRLNRDL